MLGVAASRGLELGLQSSLVRSLEFAGEALESRGRSSKRCDVQVRISLRFRSIIAALDPAVPNQPELRDFQWPSIRVGRRNQGGGGEVEREVKAGAKEKWPKHNESALSGDTPLPLPMAYPGTEPLTKKEMDAQFSCNPELQYCKDVVYQWTSKCQRCQGTGEVSFYRKRGKEVISKCIACTGIGYVQRITSNPAKIEDSDTP